MNANKKFVAWDWNGTLLDDTHIVLDCVNMVLKEAELPAISLNDLRNHHCYPLVNFYRSIGMSDDKVETIVLGDKKTFHDTYELSAHQAKLRTGTIDILAALHTQGVANYILSNHIADQIVRILKQHNIDHHFDEVIAYINREKQFNGQTKGDKLVDYLAANDLDATQGIIIGDTEEEVDIAHKLGMISVSITGGMHAEHRLRGKQPHYVIHALTELSPILREHGFIS